MNWGLGFGVWGLGFAFPRVREARPWAAPCNAFGVPNPIPQTLNPIPDPRSTIPQTPRSFCRFIRPHSKPHAPKHMRRIVGAVAAAAAAAVTAARVVPGGEDPPAVLDIVIPTFDRHRIRPGIVRCRHPCVPFVGLGSLTHPKSGERKSASE